MEASEMAERLVQVEQRSKSNTHRIDDLERNYDLLNAIAKNTEVMAVEQRHIAEKVDDLDLAMGRSAESIRQDIQEDINGLGKRVNALEKVPAARWNAVVDKVITGALGTIIGAIIGAVLALVMR